VWGRQHNHLLHTQCLCSHNACLESNELRDKHHALDAIPPSCDLFPDPSSCLPPVFLLALFLIPLSQIFMYNGSSWEEDTSWSAKLDEGWKLDTAREACYKALAEVREEGEARGGGALPVCASIRRALAVIRCSMLQGRSGCMQCAAGDLDDPLYCSVPCFTVPCRSARTRCTSVQQRSRTSTRSPVGWRHLCWTEC
jgi:hypothetical protein